MLITIQHAPAPAHSFRIVHNDHLRGKFAYPLKALERVILLHLVSLDTGWRVTRAQIDDSVVEGRDAVSTALSGLESKGFLRRSKVRDTTTGVWSWSWAVTIDPAESPLPPSLAEPSTDSPETENQSMAPTCENTPKPQVAPPTGNPSTENQSITTEDLPQKTSSKEDSNTVAAAPVGELFEILWEKYAKKVQRDAAFAAFKRALKVADWETIIAAVPAYVASTPDKKFRAHLATWLNQKCWNDEVIQPQGASQPFRNSQADYNDHGGFDKPLSVTTDDVRRTLGWGKETFNAPLFSDEIEKGPTEVLRAHIDRARAEWWEATVEECRSVWAEREARGADKYSGVALDWVRAA